MVLTNDELLSSLQNEARILLHLITKIEPGVVNYRPTEKQRSTLELLRYLSIMGPELITSVKEGGFNAESWGKAEAHAGSLSFDEVQKEISQLPAKYEALLVDFSDEDYRTQIEMFGQTQSKGAFLVNLAIAGHAAYRTQLFLYLKSNGRSELNTGNLWSGIDMEM